jgi:hypothetical protein
MAAALDNDPDMARVDTTANTEVLKGGRGSRGRRLGSAPCPHSLVLLADDVLSIAL